MKEGELLYSGNDQMEAAMLRSVLLFNGKVSNTKREDMRQKAILAIVIYGKGATKLSDIELILSRRFNVDISSQEILQIIRCLSEKGLVNQNQDSTIVANYASRDKEDFFSKLEAETDALVDGVISRVLYKSNVTVSETDRARLPQNVRNALSVYYSMYGYKYFGVSVKPAAEGVQAAVDIARKNLSKHVGQAIVRALADTIENPSESEAITLEKWARAYVAMEVMNLDPLLRNFKLTTISQKEFVIDTDVALNAITTHARLSQDYRLMIECLKKARCKLYVPKMVVAEILDHADAAYKWYGSLGPKVVELTDELLDNQISNVFIEDYVKRIQADPSLRDMPFEIYLDNYRSKEDPSFIWNCIKDVFGDDVEKNQLHLVQLNDEIKQSLKNKVLEETTATLKGTRRSEEKNEEIAEFDTSLYLTLLSMNKNSDEDEKPLSQRTYLLTSSDRTNRCAMDVGLYQRDICCNPKGLLAMMQETGSLGGQKVEIINLFENPFLVFTANEVWQEVEPILKSGAYLKHVELRRLRLDVDTHIDRILMCKTPEERLIEAQRHKDRGYLFSQDLVVANQTIAQQGKVISEKDATIQSQAEEIAALKAMIIKNEESYLRSQGRKKNKHGRRKP